MDAEDHETNPTNHFFINVISGFRAAIDQRNIYIGFTCN